LSDLPDYVRLPHTLGADKPLVLADTRLTDEQFIERQREFVQHLFGHCAFLRERSREMPVSDAFLSVFVMLFEVLDLNAPEQSRYCATQLHQIMQVLFPGLGGMNGFPIVDGIATRGEKDGQ
jgi:hypothetical protein